MSNNIIVAIPGEMTFREWTDDLNKSAPAFNVPIAAVAEHSDNGNDAWHSWVYAFISVNPQTIVTLPYDNDWRAWANFFINDLNAR